MMEFSAKLFTFLAIVATASAASVSIAESSPITRGIVTNITRCGGYGTPLQLRISECDGKCSLTPGRVYNAEYDIIPSMAAPSLSLAVDLLHPLYGNIRLFVIEIPNSSIQPGFTYTVKFSFVPNDILSGLTVRLRAIIFHTPNRYLELCIETEVDILEVGF